MFLCSFLAIKLSRFLKVNVSFVFISFWLFYEELHQIWYISWPWLSLGNIFLPIKFYHQFYKLFGSQSGTIVILIFNYLIYQFFKVSIKRKIKIMFKLVSFLSIIIGYGFYDSTYNQIIINNYIKTKAFYLIKFIHIHLRKIMVL